MDEGEEQKETKKMSALSDILNPSPLFLLPPNHIETFAFVPRVNLRYLREEENGNIEILLEPPIFSESIGKRKTLVSEKSHVLSKVPKTGNEKEGKTIQTEKSESGKGEEKKEAENKEKEKEETQGESHNRDCIYDDCDEIRRKIKNLLTTGVKVTHWLKEIGGVNSNSYQRFMSQKGPLTGCENRIYPAAYFYFENQRIAEGRPKSNRRKESEIAFPEGYSRQAMRGKLVCTSNVKPVLDRIGRLSFIPV